MKHMAFHPLAVCAIIAPTTLWSCGDYFSSCQQTKTCETEEDASATSDGAGASGTIGDAGDSDRVDGTGAAGSDGSGTGAAGSGGSGTASGGSGGADGAVDDVCTRWNADRGDLSEGTWSGNIEGCDPGEVSEEGRINTLRVVNLYRWLAQLPPVVTDTELDEQSQQCALIMAANDSISPAPPDTWTCWTMDGAEAASKSLISNAPGVLSVDRYMTETIDSATMKHRRWLLSNSLGPVGLGSNPDASCISVIDGAGDATRSWTAWPAPGTMPIEAMAPRESSVDDTGWTLQSDTIDLNNAEVKVTSNGAELPVTMTQLMLNFGSLYGLRFTPDGWQSETGKTYSVSVTGLSETIEYDVEFVQCE